jgi:hypothetical protein
MTSSAGGIFTTRSLDPRDRRLLLICAVIAVLLAGTVTLLAPREDDSDPVPSSFSSASHGAEAGFLALERTGYHIERWEQPLADLASQSDRHTVLILAEPSPAASDSAKPAIQKILNRGGRVVATGVTGGLLLPDNHATAAPSQGPQCSAQPKQPDVANDGVIDTRPGANWAPSRGQLVEYACAANPVVVRYPVGSGTAVWWANSLPIENAAIARDGNLALLLYSLGSDPHARVVWDESLHQDVRGIWSYTQGTPVKLLWAQLAFVAILLVFSFSRRSGPLLPDPVLARDTQLEFVHSLGALYDKANATNTAISIAYARFRLLIGSRSAAEIVSIVNSRAGRTLPGLPENIAVCEDINYAAESSTDRNALSLVQSLWTYEAEVHQGQTGERRGTAK